MTAPTNATELLERASRSFCITWQVVEFAVWHRGQPRPWKWKQANRVPLEKRQISMTRGEVLRATFCKEERKITMIGNGSFKVDGDPKSPTFGRTTHLAVDVVLQPHTPAEHEMFEGIVKARGAGLTLPVSLSVENGALKLSTCIAVPEFEKDHETGKVALKADMDEKRRAAAEANEQAKQAEKDAVQASADANAKAQKAEADRVAEIAAKAGATAAKEVLKNAKPAA